MVSLSDQTKERYKLWKNRDPANCVTSGLPEGNGYWRLLSRIVCGNVFFTEK
jgi:hypothetical protein